MSSAMRITITVAPIGEKTALMLSATAESGAVCRSLKLWSTPSSQRDQAALFEISRPNTTTATIPLSLWDYEEKLKTGDRLLLAAFGGGFTWGGAYLTWAYDGAKAPKLNGNTPKPNLTKSPWL